MSPLPEPWPQAVADMLGTLVDSCPRGRDEGSIPGREGHMAQPHSRPHAPRPGWDASLRRCFYFTPHCTCCLEYGLSSSKCPLSPRPDSF